MIDAANSGDLILVPPGTYEEMVIMNKKVRLQGWGAPATVINAAKYPAEKLQAWRNKVNQLLAANTFDLLPGQETGFNAPNNEPVLFNTEEAPGILVVAKAIWRTKRSTTPAMRASTASPSPVRITVAASLSTAMPATWRSATTRSSATTAPTAAASGSAIRT